MPPLPPTVVFLMFLVAVVALVIFFWVSFLVFLVLDFLNLPSFLEEAGSALGPKRETMAEVRARGPRGRARRLG